MKLRTIKLFLLLTFLNPIIASATDWCADAGLEAGYYMDEASGNLDDCSSNDNDMVPTATPPGNYASAGQFGNAFDFTESNDDGFSSTDIAAMTNITTLSVGAWTAPDSDGATTGGIVNKWDGSDGWQFRLVTGAGPNEFTLRYQWTGGVGAWQTTTTPVVFTPAWQHLAVTYNAAGGSGVDPVFYYNGVSQSLTETNTPSLSPDDDTGGEPCIGITGDGSGTGTASEFDGDIDEVFVYNGGAVLDSTDINDIMDNGLTSVAAATAVTDTGGGFI